LKTIDTEVQGLRVYIDDPSLKPIFESKTMKFSKVYGGEEHGKMKWQEVSEKLYKSVPRKGFYTGVGAIQWINQNSDILEINIKSVYPERGILESPLLIPESLRESPKFEPDGNRRFYFFEALEACFRNPNGTIKLPTGSGKTEIQLTLAYNQSEYVGTGMILVPTITIKNQFIERGKKYGIEIIDYYDIGNEKELKEGSIVITSHHAIYEKLKTKKKRQEAKDLLDHIKWIVVDECAHATCNSWFSILLALDNCQRAHGFSALPVAFKTKEERSFDKLNSDDARVIAILGQVIYERTSKELEEFLNLPNLINVKYKWPSSNPAMPDNRWEEMKSSRKWHDIIEALNYNLDRVEVIAGLFDYLLDNGYKVATFVKSKDYAKRILSRVQSDKLICWFGGEVIFDKERDLQEKEFKEKFGSQYLGVLLTSHGIEGLDFDDPLNVLILHEGKSVRQTVQKVGRIVRADKRPSIVINFCDRGCSILPNHGNLRAGDIIKEFGSDPVNCSTFSDLLEQINVIQENYEENNHE
jgi:superfamily II DNA or RNA helicase